MILNDTSAALYRVTNEKKSAERHSEFMEYLDQVVLNHSCGSWFHPIR